MVLQNGWKKVQLICWNHGDNYTNEMTLKKTEIPGKDTVFYTCPHYKDRYKQEGIQEFCNNRISIKDYMSMLSKLTDLRYTDIEETNLTGVEWSRNGIHFKVQSCDDDGNMVVLMKNQKAIGR